MPSAAFKILIHTTMPLSLIHRTSLRTQYARHKSSLQQNCGLEVVQSTTRYRAVCSCHPLWLDVLTLPDSLLPPAFNEFNETKCRPAERRAAIRRRSHGQSRGKSYPDNIGLLLEVLYVRLTPHCYAFSSFSDLMPGAGVWPSVARDVAA